MRMEESGEREVGTRDRSHLHGEKLLWLEEISEYITPKSVEKGRDKFINFIFISSSSFLCYPGCHYCGSFPTRNLLIVNIRNQMD